MPVLSVDQITTSPRATTKDEAIQEAADMLVAAGAVTPDYAEAMRERERSVSTYMGNLLAIPHGTNESKDAILDSALSVARYETPLDWDGNPVRFVVGIAGKDGGHLEILSKIAIIFSDDDSVRALLDARTPDDLHALLSEVNES